MIKESDGDKVVIPKDMPVIGDPLILDSKPASADQETSVIPALNVLHGFPPGQPTIDALSALDDEQNTTFLFQITKAKNHGVSSTGIQAVMDAFHEKLVNQLRSQGNSADTKLKRKYVSVVIASEEERALSVLSPHRHGIPIDRTGLVIPVGYTSCCRLKTLSTPTR